MKCLHCSIHGASVVMSVRLLQWNGFAFDSNPADTLRLLHSGDYITSFLCLDNGIRVRHCVGEFGWGMARICLHDCPLLTGSLVR